MKGYMTIISIKTSKLKSEWYKILFGLILLVPQTGFTEEAPLPETSQSINFLEALLSANLIVQITFVILLILSIMSWAIVLQKHALFKNQEKENKPYDDIFLKTHSFEEIHLHARSHETSSLSQIFLSGYNEMQKIFKTRNSNESKEGKASLFGLDNVERALRKGTDNEIAFLESGLTFLATVGSSSPFIGLFGTVFGIMDAFSKIAVTGSASLSVVAPGIAEALIATGLGLFVAIPATIFYNAFVNRIKKFELEFNSFSTDFLNIARRNFFREE